MLILHALARSLVVGAFLAAVFIPVTRPYVACSMAGIALGYFLCRLDLWEKFIELSVRPSVPEPGVTILESAPSNHPQH